MKELSRLFGSSALLVDVRRMVIFESPAMQAIMYECGVEILVRGAVLSYNYYNHVGNIACKLFLPYFL